MQTTDVSNVHFDEEFDVVVVGYGFAGAAASMAAHDNGAKVLLIEKMAYPGGISICSGGACRSARDFDKAFQYLKATNGGRTPDDVLAVLAEGMTTIRDHIENLAGVSGAKVISSEGEAGRAGGNYPFPGWDTFYHSSIAEVPGFDPLTYYPHVRGFPAGRLLFKVIEDNLAKQDIEIRLVTPALQLLTNSAGETTGVRVQASDGERRIKARKGIVLACGGFEANEEMKRQYWQMAPVLPVMARSNTGDGISMAQELGADLWHMWHYHGSYGFKHPDPSFPYAIRMKRLPDWFPEEGASARVQMSWIVVDQQARRYMNENDPYTQDTNHRAMELFDPVTQSFPRIPSHVILDEEGRKMYRLGMPAYNDWGISEHWTDDNLRELEMGFIRKAETLDELAELISVDAAVLNETIDLWNASCQLDRDEDFGRPPGSMMPIATPPFYTGEVWPLVSNTQGGPVHDADQRIISVTGRPIPRLFAAGELGSSFGYLYLSGGNLTECFVTGRVAGTNAASLESLD